MQTAERARIAARVREARLATGLSQERFAAKLGFYRRTIERWESGQTLPDRRGREALARESGKAASFFGDEDEAAPAAPVPVLDQYILGLIRQELDRRFAPEEVV